MRPHSWLRLRKHRRDKTAVLTDERLDGDGSTGVVSDRPKHLWASGEVLFVTNGTLSWDELAARAAVSGARYLGHV